MDHQPGTNPPVKTTQRKITALHIFLFVATLVTTLIAGALQQGVNVLNDPLSIWQGIPFSFSLIIILGTHELGHYIMSRRHHVDVTLPYFIPAPSFIGTFGAVIKLKSPLYDRRTLLDIGVAGPFAGLIVAVPILAVGLSLSEIVPYSGEEGIRLGTCLLFSIMNWIINGPMPENASLMLHPVAFSGWIGLLVTALNLLPVGQLDGGHVAYAIFGRRQRLIARVFMAILLFLGALGWTGWFVWFALLLFIGIDHPPVTYGWIGLDGKRRLAGWIAIIVFAVTFMPAPF